MRLLDLFCGTNTEANPHSGFSWSRVFAKRGWTCFGFDLLKPFQVPRGCFFYRADVVGVNWSSHGFFDSYCGKEYTTLRGIDFIVASPPCEEFSVWGMKHFHPNPKYPENGIKLFNHTRELCEASGLPHVIENVRAAQQFVGNAVHHCGPFYLWGNAVPPLLNQGIKKGFKLGNGATARILKETGDRSGLREWRKKMDCWHSSKSPQRIANAAKVATIPPELANCVAEYAERICERKVTA